MKTVMLSLVVVLACVATAYSSPFYNWMNEIEDLNTKQLLELQEQGPTPSPPRLNCFICEENCASEEELEQCEVDFSCATVEAVNTVTDQQLKVKVCLPSAFCSQEATICNNFNNSASNNNQLGFCQLSCCNTDGCNAEPTAPPTTPSTEPPTTPSTEPPTTPSTELPTTPSTAPPTTPSTEPPTTPSTEPPTTPSTEPPTTPSTEPPTTPSTEPPTTPSTAPPTTPSTEPPTTPSTEPPTTPSTAPPTTPSTEPPTTPSTEPPTTPSTEPPTTPSTAPPTTPSTEPPTTPTTEPPMTPTTTPAPVVIALTRSRGVIQTPGFSINQPYGSNLDITWTISGRMIRRGRGLFLDFLTLRTETGRDFITIKRGNALVRRLSGVFPRRGKRSTLLNLLPEDGPCERDDDEPEVFDDYDPAYKSLADAYMYYLFRRQRPVLRLCIPGNNQPISINFSSDGNNNGALGFRARFRVRRGDDK